MHVGLNLQGKVDWLTLKTKALQSVKMLGLFALWHSVTFHKTWIFITTVVGTSDLMKLKFCKLY